MLSEEHHGWPRERFAELRARNKSGPIYLVKVVVLELHPDATHLCCEKHRKGAAARIAIEYRDAA